MQIDDLVEPLFGGETNERQSETGDVAIETDEFEVRNHLAREHPVHLRGKIELVGEGIKRLQIGPGRIDTQCAQGGVIPGQFEHRRQPLEIARGGGVEHDLAGVSRRERLEGVVALRRHHHQNHALAFGEEF